MMVRSPSPADGSPPAGRLARPVALVGLMGAGKTSVGKRIASLLGVPFVDSDVEIETAAAMSISEIFARLGEPAFRDGERRVITRLLAAPPCVIATGGGAFIDPGTRAVLKAKALSVWLRADLDLLWDRVRDRPGRPLLANADPRGTLDALLEARAPFYGLADLTVDSHRGASHEVMARRVIDALHARDLARPDLPPVLEPQS